MYSFNFFFTSFFEWKELCRIVFQPILKPLWNITWIFRQWHIRYLFGIHDEINRIQKHFFAFIQPSVLKHNVGITDSLNRKSKNSGLFYVSSSYSLSRLLRDTLMGIRMMGFIEILSLFSSIVLELITSKGERTLNGIREQPLFNPMKLVPIGFQNFTLSRPEASFQWQMIPSWAAGQTFWSLSFRISHITDGEL